MISNDAYDRLKQIIESMSKEDRMARLDELSSELFIMANSFAGDEHGTIAQYLHESVNNIMAAQQIFTGDKEDVIPLRFLLSSIGLQEPLIRFKPEQNGQGE